MYSHLLPTEAFIRNFRQSIPDGTKTAGAIDRQASWLKIASLAIQDGYHAFAAHLLGVCEQRLEGAK